MNEPTTAEIRERHEEDQADIELTRHEARGIGTVDCIDETHTDRGILLDRLEAAKQEIKNCHADIDQLREIDGERLNVEIPALEAKLATVKEIIRTQKMLQYDEWVVREDDLLEVLK